MEVVYFFFFFQAEDGIRDADVTGVQTCALPISWGQLRSCAPRIQEQAAWSSSAWSAGATKTVKSSSGLASSRTIHSLGTAISERSGVSSRTLLSFSVKAFSETIGMLVPFLVCGGP